MANLLVLAQQRSSGTAGRWSRRRRPTVGSTAASGTRSTNTSGRSSSPRRRRRPVDLNALVADARTREIAAEIYTASLLAIDVDTPAERAYLAMLAARLELPHPLVASIHAELGIPGPAEPLPAAPRRAAS